MSIELFKDLLQQAFGPALVFPFLTTKDARELRRVCRDFLGIVSAFRWHDMTTRVKELVLWRRCFPNATACLVGRRARNDGSISSWFEVNPFEGIKWIKFLSIRGLGWCTSKYVSLFANAETLHIDEVQNCHVKDVCKVDPRCLLHVRDLTIKCDLTDEHLEHLARTGVRKLKVSGYNFSFTDARLKMLDKLESFSLQRLNDYSMVPPDPCAVLTDAALAGLQSLTYLCLYWVPCTFTASGFAPAGMVMPLRVLQLVLVDGITIPAGALGKYLPYIECLRIHRCNIALADEDIREMRYLTQLVLDDCPAVITSSALLELVYEQIEQFGQGVIGPGCHLEPSQFDWECIKVYDEPPIWWPISLYNRDNRDQIIGLRQAIHEARCDHQARCDHKGLLPQSGLNLPYLTQVSIQDCPRVVFTLEHYNALIELVPYVSFEPSHLVGNEGWVADSNDECDYSMNYYPGWDEYGDPTPQ